ncbi:hypothetical protein [Nocardia sp. NPDC057455]|uniref:hypothetical protein n=1 Tax=Nocardia sp. NPDC057455 TaxID=3346138 RepID=UPI00366F91CA
MTDHDTWDSLWPEWWDGDEKWEDVLAQRLGWEEVPLSDDYPRHCESIWMLDGAELRAALEARQKAIEDYESSSAAYQAYAASRDRKRELLAQIPVELDTYGWSEGDSVWALRVKPSVQHVDDWGSVPLKPLDVDPAWAGQIARFVELLELTVPEGGPGWHLNCSYG